MENEKMFESLDRYWNEYNGRFLEYTKIEVEAADKLVRLVVGFIGFTGILLGADGLDISLGWPLYSSWTFHFLAVVIGYWLMKYKASGSTDLIEFCYNIQCKEMNARYTNVLTEKARLEAEAKCERQNEEEKRKKLTRNYKVLHGIFVTFVILGFGFFIANFVA